MLSWLRSGRILMQKNKLLVCVIDTDEEGNRLYHCPCCLMYIWVTKCQENGTTVPAFNPRDYSWVVCYSSTMGMIYWPGTDKWYQLNVLYNEPINGIFKRIVPQLEEGDEYIPSGFRTEEYAKKTLDNVSAEKLKEWIEEACKCQPQIIASGISYEDDEGVEHSWVIPDEIKNKKGYPGHRWKIVETSYNNYVKFRGNISSKGELLGLPPEVNLYGKGYTSHWTLMTGCREEGYILWPEGYEDGESPPKKE